VPTICLGPADGNEESPDLVIGGVAVYVAAGFKAAQGERSMRVTLGRFLFWRWLVLEHARAVAVYTE